MIRQFLCLVLILAAWQNAAMASDTSVMFGINEGLAEQSGFSEMQEKYKGLAEYLSQALKKKVVIESSQNLKSSEMNLEKGRYDLMFCRPSNVAAKAMRDQKYVLVASAKGEFSAFFIVNKDSPLKKPEDIQGKSIAMPTQTSLMAKAGIATLRDMKIDPAKMHIRYERYQDALAYTVKNKFTEAAVVAPIVAKQWEKQGGRTLFQSRKLPFWSMIASSNMSPESIAKVRTALIGMEQTEQGKKILQRIGVKGFVPGNPQEYLDLLKWIGE